MESQGRRIRKDDFFLPCQEYRVGKQSKKPNIRSGRILQCFYSICLGGQLGFKVGYTSVKPRQYALPFVTDLVTV